MAIWVRLHIGQKNQSGKEHMNMFFNRVNVRSGLAAVVLGALALSGGCVSVSNMTPGKMEWIQAS